MPNLFLTPAPSHRGVLRVALVGVLAFVVAAALLAAPAPPASADTYGLEPQGPGDLLIRNPTPADGRVVPAGKHKVAVDLIAPAGVAAADLYLNGNKVGKNLAGTSKNRRLWTYLSLGPGEHKLEVYARPNNGTTVHRVWRVGVSGMPVPRLFGKGRIETAVAISKDLYPRADSAKAAVVARGDDFADALAGAPLATANDGPLLLSATRGLSRPSGDELERVLPRGATVYLLGGPNALAPKVENDLRARGFRPERLSGPDRTFTARAIAAKMPASNGVVVANAGKFPDAVSASSPAARRGFPILLTNASSLSGNTRAFLKSRRIDVAYVVGGPGVVSPATVREIDKFVGKVVRLAGRTRYETSAAIARHFYRSPDDIAAANGNKFPDALAGGPHAAARGAPILLSPKGRLPLVATGYVKSKVPSRAYLYGGPGAISDAAGTDIRRAALDHGGTLENDISPAPGKTIHNLETLQVTFRDEVSTNASTFYVEVAGQEVPGRVAQGDFKNTLVFQAGELPFDAKAGRSYPVDVVVVGRNSGGKRHLDYRLTLRKLELARGDAGGSVKQVQQRLTYLGYWVGKADGKFGTLTSQGVMAFQKYEGLPRTGALDERTRAALAAADRPRPRHGGSGRHVEIDKARQVMLFVNDGRVQWAMNTSTGTEDYYYQDGRRKLAHTPEGSFTFFRQIDGMRNAPLGQLWRPKYFTNAGHAIHGSTSVPSYPASHGCARLTYPAIDFVWAAGLAPIGTPLYVY